jgi:uncharacterized protein YcfJ
MSRIDMQSGSQNLFSIKETVQGAGNIIGGLLGFALTINNGDTKYIFLIYSAVGMLVGYLGYHLDEEIVDLNNYEIENNDL